MATYYVDSSVTDTYVASATPDFTTYNHLTFETTGGSDSVYKTIADVNAKTFSAGDYIYFRKGQTWRETLTVTASGTAGNPITFGSFGSGDKPRILGSSSLTGWADQGGNIWRAACSISPNLVWFTNTSDGKTKWGENDTGPESEYDWYWSSNYVYCYAITDPDSRYTAVEAAVRNFCFNGNSKAYLTIENLEFAYGRQYGVNLASNSCNNCIVDSCLLHHCGTAYGTNADLIVTRASNCTFKNNVLHNAGSHGIYITAINGPMTVNNSLVEHNEIYDCYHTGVDIMNQTVGCTVQDHIIRYNHIYSTTDFAFPTTCLMMSIYTSGDVAGTYCDNVEIYYNIFHHIAGPGLKVGRRTRNSNVYNNVIYGTNASYTYGAVSGINIDSTSSGIKLKNNIVWNVTPNASGGRCIYVGILGAVSECDYNCLYQDTAGHNVMEISGTGTYHNDDFTAYKAATTSWRGGSGTSNDFWEAPDLANPGGSTAVDYQLDSSSTLINSGLDVSLGEDFWGTTIPQGAAPDIGAYEYGAIPIDATIYPSPFSHNVLIVSPTIYVTYECLWKRDVKIRLS